MMRSLFSGVSGLKNHQTRMDVIGNNISNVNTTGFKSSRVTFADTLNQTMTGASAPNGTLGGTNPKQVGLGSAVSSIDLLFTDGSVQSTGKNTDLCLSGNGLFVVSNGSQTYYTRNGAFEFDAAGNYVVPGSGMLVQGWTGKDGVINTSSAVGNINIPAGKSVAAEVTSSVTYANNLNASAPTIVSGTGGTELTDILKNPGESVTCGTTYNPVRLTLSNDSVVEGSKHNPAWSYGYTTSTAGDSATVNETTAVTLTLSNGQTAIGDMDKTYTVGGKYTTATVTTTGAQITASATAPVTLLMDDGSTHTVTSGTYVVNSDNYTVNDSSGNPIATGVIKGYSTTAEITSMNVENIGGGLGVTFHVGGTASYTTTTDGDTAEADSTNTVTITYFDGEKDRTATGITGTKYTVGNNFTTEKITSGSIVVNNNNRNNIILYLEDGTTAEVPDVGTYTIDDPYQYTDDDTGNTNNTKIVGYTISGKINTLKTTYTINSIEAVKGYEANSTSPVILTMSDGTKVQETSGKYSVGSSIPITTTVTIYDTLGNAHSVPVYFTKTKTSSNEGNTWTVSIANDGTGKVTLPNSNTTVEMDDTELQFTATGKYNSGSGTIKMTLKNGATGTQTININLSDITQFAGNSTINPTGNGYQAGTLESVAIDASGVITGTYTNGVKQAEAQVAVAQFTNASGLTKTGSSLYQESNNSGTPNVKTAADLGVKITASALEMSNVDIANEFADMIVTQRGFQSNSKIITVGDEMLETVINMKR